MGIRMNCESFHQFCKTQGEFKSLSVLQGFQWKGIATHDGEAVPFHGPSAREYARSTSGPPGFQ